MPESRREVLSAPLTQEFLDRQAAQGWRPVAIEWERIPENEVRPAGLQEVPYGLRVAGDGRHLEEDQQEVKTLLAILEGIVEDRSMSAISTELNRRGMRTRNGEAWTQTAVFNLLPRIIDQSPRLFAKPEWIMRARA